MNYYGLFAGLPIDREPGDTGAFDRSALQAFARDALEFGTAFVASYPLAECIPTMVGLATHAQNITSMPISHFARLERWLRTVLLSNNAGVAVAMERYRQAHEDVHGEINRAQVEGLFEPEGVERAVRLGRYDAQGATEKLDVAACVGRALIRGCWWQYNAPALDQNPDETEPPDDFANDHYAEVGVLAGALGVADRCPPDYQGLAGYFNSLDRRELTSGGPALRLVADKLFSALPPGPRVVAYGLMGAEHRELARRENDWRELGGWGAFKDALTDQRRLRQPNVAAA